MKKAWLALSVLVGHFSAWAHLPCEDALLAGPRTFAPVHSGQLRLGDKNGWQLEWLTGESGQLELAALQKSTMLIKRIDPVTGALISERPLLGGGASPDSARLAGLASGEVLALAVYEREGRLDLYSGDRAGRWSASVGNALRFAQIFQETEKGEALVVAATVDELKIFRRASGTLEVVASLAAPNLIRSLHALPTADGRLTFALFGLDHKVRILKFSTADQKIHEDYVYDQPGGRLFVLGGDDGQMRIVALEQAGAGSTIRVFSEAARTFSSEVHVGQLLQAPVMAQDIHGGGKILLAVRDGGRTQIVGVDPISGQKSLAAPAGDARRVQNLSQFFLGFKPYYIFGSDGVRAQIQSANEGSIFPSSAGGYIHEITGVRRLADGRRVVAVVAESAGGTHLSLITLSK